MKAVWIWYPHDFELYHGMLQNFQREERGFGWPAYWKMDDWNKNVRFARTYELTKPTSFTVHGVGMGYVAVNGVKHPLETEILCEAGTNVIEVFIGNMTGLPCVHIDGEVIRSGADWTADNFVEELPVGTCALYERLDRDPNRIYYQEKHVTPTEVYEYGGGLLFDFGRLVNGTLRLTMADLSKKVSVQYGESVEEAVDSRWCYYKEENANSGTAFRRRAFRYIFLPGLSAGGAELTATHQYVPLETKASFYCGDELVNRVWCVAEETYKLCGGLFFIDGVKRDRWIWSGDAYQSYFVNPYLLFDPEIDKRTIRALRGNLGIEQHINTIVDYSMLWLISLENEYRTYGDLAFLREMYPKMEDMMGFLMRQRNEHGFIYGRERDWIYIDWAELDKCGPISAEQMLLAHCYRAMCDCGRLLGEDVTEYEREEARLRGNIMRFYWNEERGAFIDSYESGKNHVTRHANIFAVLFDIADKEQSASILKNVLNNPDVPEITTPYFKFFELDVRGKCGELDKVWESIRSYWGGMLKRGAVTFWEQFDPRQDAPEQYAMYGDPFGKSLCHAWAASPVYLLGRYFLGVRPLEAGYRRFVVEPRLEYFNELDCTTPVMNGSVRICYQNGELRVTSDREGGVLIRDGTQMEIPRI